MLSTARSKGLERSITIASAPAITLPSFLVPAFKAGPRHFSSSTNHASQIGRAPLSIPPEVNFRVLDPPVKTNGKYTAEIAKRSVEIEGPLGRIAVDGDKNRSFVNTLQGKWQWKLRLS
jgi:large subunit ribosomal protein L6